MKSINFHKNDSVFRFMKEKKGVPKKTNWDRIIYLIIIGLIVFFFGKYFVYKAIFIEGEGLVMMEKLDIRVIDDCRILEIKVKEGDTINRKDTLFTYIDDIEGTQGLSLYVGNGEGSRNWIEKELYTLNKTKEIKKLEITENQSQITELNSILKKMKAEIILDLIPKSRLEKYQSDLFDLKFNMKKLYKEIQFLDKYKASLDSMDISGRGLALNSNDSHGLKTFICPIDSGYITTVNKTAFEVALKSEEILTIHKPNKIIIKAFFDQADLQYIKKGRIVKIEFPDGSTGKGFINNLYAATNKLPEEFQKKYESTTRGLTVDIEPESAEELSKWKSFYKMSVKVYTSKFQFLNKLIL